jgi:hypothetical protein
MVFERLKTGPFSPKLFSTYKKLIGKYLLSNLNLQ